MYQLFGKGFSLKQLILLASIVLLVFSNVIVFQSTQKIQQRLDEHKAEFEELKRVVDELIKLPEINKSPGGVLTASEVRQLMNRRGLQADTLTERRTGEIVVNIKKIQPRRLFSFLELFQKELVIVKSFKVIRLQGGEVVSSELIIER